jgi:hypothetical protein
MNTLSIDGKRLLGRLRELGQIGRDRDGRLVRLAGSDADKAARDTLAAWIRQAGLELAVDRIGNIFGIFREAHNADKAPILLGSHIDTVINAGIYDGCYGVLAGLEVIDALKAAGLVPARPIAVAAFTNEEGVRYAPDMMGSLVYAGGLSTEEALATVGTDGTVLGRSYSGSAMPAPRSQASSSRMPMSSCTSSRGLCWSAKACPSARSRTFRASPGSGSPSTATPTTPARRRCRCAEMPAMPLLASSPSCVTGPATRKHPPSRPWAA